VFLETLHHTTFITPSEQVGKRVDLDSLCPSSMAKVLDVLYAATAPLASFMALTPEGQALEDELCRVKHCGKPLKLIS
jgi:hypothetical protein